MTPRRPPARVRLLLLATAASTATALVAEPAAAAVVAVVARGNDLAGIALDGSYLAVAQNGLAGRPGIRVRLIDLADGLTLVDVRRHGPCGRPTVWSLAVAAPRMAWNVSAECDGQTVQEQFRTTPSRQVVATPASVPIGPIVGGGGTLVVQSGNRIVVLPGSRRGHVIRSAILSPVAVDRGRVLTRNIVTGGLRLFSASGGILADMPGVSATFASVSDGLIAALPRGRSAVEGYTTRGRHRRTYRIGRHGGRIAMAYPYAVYTGSGRSVHLLDLRSGRDRVLLRAPAGTRLLDADIAPGTVVYAYRLGTRGTSTGGRVATVTIPLS